MERHLYLIIFYNWVQVIIVIYQLIWSQTWTSNKRQKIPKFILYQIITILLFPYFNCIEIFISLKLIQIIYSYKNIQKKQYLNPYIYINQIHSLKIQYLIQNMSTMSKFLTSTTATIIISTIIRILLVIYISKYQQISAQKLSGTDIDYKVYTDAIEYESPYNRHTYRYSPLLAYMMYYNNICEYSGKLIFVLFDILAMFGLYKIFKKQQNGYESSIIKLYGYNPLFIYLTIRGSCQSINMAFMFWSFYFIYDTHGNTVFDQISKSVVGAKIQDKRSYPRIGYIVYGIWVHFRVYPILLLPLILIHQHKLSEITKNKSFITKFITISVLAGGTFMLLFAIFYHKYGYPFVEQTYLYHLTRLDNRHSFSPIFYQIYLSLNTQSFMRSMAQIVVIIAITRRIHKSMSPFYCHFIIMYAFVSFNKVITMQYYMWVIGALLLVLPESTLLTNKHRRFQKAFSYIMQWMLGILLWVWLSIKLEKQGENVFNLMWLVCIGKLFSDIWAVTGFMTTVRNKQGYQAIPTSDKLGANKKQKNIKMVKNVKNTN